MTAPDGYKLTTAQVRLIARLRSNMAWRPQRKKSKRSWAILVRHGAIVVTGARVRICVN